MEEIPAEEIPVEEIPVEEIPARARAIDYRASGQVLSILEPPGKRTI